MSDVSVPANTTGRRLDIGGAPAPPIGLLACALAAVMIAVASGWYTVATLHEVVGKLVPASTWWVDVVSGLLLLVSAAVIWPLQRAFVSSNAVRRAAARQDSVGARAARADANVHSWIAIGYSTAQVLVVLLVQFFMVNNLAVAKTFLDLPLIINTFPLVLSAFWLNVELFLISGVAVLIWGLIVAVAELAPGPAGRPLRLIATAYVDTFRAIPAILTLFLVAFGIPLTGLPILSTLPQIVLIIISLTLTTGAYVAEIYRAGIIGIHWSQTAAARSLGLSHLQTLRFVTIPQGVRQIIPPLLNSLIALQKDTALVTVVGAIDAFNQSMIIASSHYNLSAVSTVAALFILISIPQTRFVERMMQRDRKRRMRAES